MDFRGLDTAFAILFLLAVLGIVLGIWKLVEWIF